MATIYNSELTKELLNATKLQVSRDIVPNQIAEKVVPTVETNPRLLKTSISKSARYTNSGTTREIYTTEAGKDFYLTGFGVSFIKNAACDMVNTSIYMTIVQGGATVKILEFETLTLTAADKTQYVALNFPLKVDRGSVIYVTHAAFAAGNFQISGCVNGYYVENPNA